MSSDIKPFFIEVSDRFSDERVQLCWRVLVPWVTERATTYRILCEPGKKGSPRIIELLAAHATTREEPGEKKKSRFRELLRTVTRQPPALVFSGRPDLALNDILLLGPLPDESVPADLAPVSEIVLSRNGEPLFTSYDYGRFQTLYVTGQEIREVRELLTEHELPQELVVEAKDGGAADKAPWFYGGRLTK